MTVTVYFATNRDITGPEDSPVFGPHFNANGPTYLRFGMAEVARPASPGGNYRLASVQLAPEQIPGVNAPMTAAPVLGSQLIFETLRQKLKDSKSDLLLLIHGYAATFSDAMERAAQLKVEYNQDANPIEVAVFSWPADGTMVPLIDYQRDRDDAMASGPAIARALLKLLDFFRDMDRDDYCFQDLHLVAHSMGNYALRHTVQALLRQYPGRIMPRIFKNIFLMAADEDNDAFEFDHKFARLPELAEAVHIYYSSTDGALTISDVTKGNPDRLGSTGPRKLSDLPHKVTLIDCGEVNETSPMTEVRHQYYRKRPEVIADIWQVLADIPADLINNREYIPPKRSYRIKEWRQG
jgi:esterase/lipase superfamily enzyme